MLAQNAPVAAMRSVSGQFVIHDLRGLAPARLSPPGQESSWLALEPPFLVVSCERIKQALCAELGTDRSWTGTIHATIRPGRGNHDVAQINVERFGAGWNYRVELPQKLERTQFVRTLVQVLLLEMANRTARERSAEIPLWLSEGLTQRLLVANEAELILAPPTQQFGSMLMTPTMIETRDPDPLAAARRVLLNRPPPTIEELSWPQVEQFSPEAAEVFQRSAQLFVAELLRLQDGPRHLHAFVDSLAQYYNWQTAFLRAYEDHFASQLALEKWWTLQAAYFVGRDHQHLWTLEESAQKLDALLHTPVAIRVVQGELPARSDLSLQVVIREWDTPRQMATLQAKLNDLARARRRVAPQFMTLVNDYALVLDDYLKKRKRSTTTFGDIRTLPPSIKKVAREAVQQLDALDARRAQLSNQTAPLATGSPEGSSARK